MKYYIKVVDKKVRGGVKGKYLWNKLTDGPLSYYVKSNYFQVTDSKGNIYT